MAFITSYILTRTTKNRIRIAITTQTALSRRVKPDHLPSERKCRSYTFIIMSNKSPLLLQRSNNRNRYRTPPLLNTHNLLRIFARSQPNLISARLPNSVRALAALRTNAYKAELTTTSATITYLSAESTKIIQIRTRTSLKRTVRNPSLPDVSTLKKPLIRFHMTTTHRSRPPIHHQLHSIT